MVPAYALEIADALVSHEEPRPETCLTKHGERCDYIGADGTCAECGTQHPATAVRSARSIVAMLGWDNMPPLRTLEREINALKVRAKSQEEP